MDVYPVTECSSAIADRRSLPSDIGLVHRYHVFRRFRFTLYVFANLVFKFPNAAEIRVGIVFRHV